MAAPDLHDPAPVGIDPTALSRFDLLCSRMGLIADGVNAFTDPVLREKAYYELTNIINPPSDDNPDYHAEGVYCGEPAHCTPPHEGALPGTPYAVRSNAELGRIADWFADDAPTAWREAAAPCESLSDATVAMLTRGAEAWTDLLLVKRALIDEAGFSADDADGDLAALIRQMASDPPPISPEVEELARRLREQAQPGESAVQVALRLTQELHLDKVDDRGQGAS